MPNFLTTAPAEARCHLLLAHGAGAAMTSPFLEQIAGLVAAEGVAVHRFEFQYMAARRSGASRRPPPAIVTLIPEYEAAVAALRSGVPRGAPLIIGGKSMGGRVASLAAGRLHATGEIAGLVAIGYPFHPPGKPERLRTAHLEDLACPTLIVQGERDPLGSREDVESYSLSASIGFVWVGGGDHDLKPARRTGQSYAEALAVAATAIADFCRSVSRPQTSTARGP